jgi:hypothetical protein
MISNGRTSEGTSLPQQPAFLSAGAKPDEEKRTFESAKVNGLATIAFSRDGRFVAASR